MSASTHTIASLISLTFLLCCWCCHAAPVTTTPAWHSRFGDGTLSNSAPRAGLDLFTSAGNSAAWAAVPDSNRLPWQVVQIYGDLAGYPQVVSVEGPGATITNLACCSTSGLPVLFGLDTRQGDSMGALRWATQVNLSAFNVPTFSFYQAMPSDLLLAVVPPPAIVPAKVEGGARGGGQLQQGQEQHHNIVVSAIGGYGQVPAFACIAAHNITSGSSNSSSGSSSNATATMLWSHCYDMKWSLDGYPLVRLVQLSDGLVGFFYSNTTALHMIVYHTLNGTLVARQALPMLERPPGTYDNTANFVAFAVSVPQILSDAQAWTEGVSFAVSFTGTPQVSRWHLNLTTQQAQRVWVQDPTAHDPRCNITACWHPSPAGNSWTLGLNAGINTPVWSAAHGVLVHYCTQAVVDRVVQRPGCLTGLSAETGAVLWQHPAPAVVPVTLSLHNATAVVVTSGTGWFGWPPNGPSLMMGVDITTGQVRFRTGPGEDAIYGWSTMDGRGRVYVEAQLGRMSAVLAYSSEDGHLVGSTRDTMVNEYGIPSLMGAPFHVGSDGGLYSTHSRYGPLIAMYPLPSPGPTASPMPYPSYSPTPSPAAAAGQGAGGQGGAIAGGVVGGALAAAVMLGLAYKVRGRLLRVKGSGGLAAAVDGGEGEGNSSREGGGGGGSSDRTRLQLPTWADVTMSASGAGGAYEAMEA